MAKDQVPSSKLLKTKRSVADDRKKPKPVVIPVLSRHNGAPQIKSFPDKKTEGTRTLEGSNYSTPFVLLLKSNQLSPWGENVVFSDHLMV